MKTCTKCKEEKSLDDFYKRAGGVLYKSECKQCSKKNVSNWDARNKEKRAAIDRRSKSKHSEKVKACQSRWREKNKGYATQYARINRSRTNAASAKRRAIKLLATPIWANADKIEVEYELAAWCSTVTGERYEVDHIVPLQNGIVCGLHNEFNLQVIQMSDNRAKKNRHWPDMPTGV